MALFCPATVLLVTWAAGDVARVSAQVSGERVAVVLHGPAVDGAAAARLAEALGVGVEHMPALDPGALVEVADRYRGECVLALAGPGEVASVVGEGPLGEGAVARLEVDEDGITRLPWPRQS